MKAIVKYPFTLSIGACDDEDMNILNHYNTNELEFPIGLEGECGEVSKDNDYESGEKVLFTTSIGDHTFSVNIDPQLVDMIE